MVVIHYWQLIQETKQVTHNQISDIYKKRKSVTNNNVEVYDLINNSAVNINEAYLDCYFDKGTAFDELYKHPPKIEVVSETSNEVCYQIYQYYLQEFESYFWEEQLVNHPSEYSIKEMALYCDDFEYGNVEYYEPGYVEWDNDEKYWIYKNVMKVNKEDER